MPRRYPVSKKKSRKAFKRHANKTKGVNMRTAPMRGGVRF